MSIYILSHHPLLRRDNVSHSWALIKSSPQQQVVLQHLQPLSTSWPLNNLLVSTGEGAYVRRKGRRPKNPKMHPVALMSLVLESVRSNCCSLEWFQTTLSFLDTNWFLCNVWFTSDFDSPVFWLTKLNPARRLFLIHCGDSLWFTLMSCVVPCCVTIVLIWLCCIHDSPLRANDRLCPWATYSGAPPGTLL